MLIYVEFPLYALARSRDGFHFQPVFRYLFDLLEKGRSVPDMHTKTCGPSWSPVYLIEGAEDPASCGWPSVIDEYKNV